MKKLLASAAAVALISGGFVLASATGALAHDKAMTADCDSLQVTLTNYPSGSTVESELDPGTR